MNEYRDLAFEAITTLGVLVDLLGAELSDRIGNRVSTMAMKLAVYDSDEADEDDAATRALLMKGLLYELQNSGEEPESAPPSEPEQEWAAFSDGCGDPEETIGWQEDWKPEEHNGNLSAFPAPAPLPKIDVIKRRESEATEDMTVTRLPGVEVKPLPNEHPIDLKGTGRSGRPPARFKMRERGKGRWFEGTAGECAKHFGVTASQVYKWAGGKAKSGNYEAARL